MDLDTLKQILDLVREHELSELEVEQDGLRLKIRKDAAAPVVVAVPVPRGRRGRAGRQRRGASGGVGHATSHGSRLTRTSNWPS